MKFLIDECLTVELSAIAWNRGCHCMHVTWLGLQSRADPVILQRALEEDWVIVTNNTTDFVRLLAREEIHPGLVCLSALPRFMNKELQKLLFEHALELLRGKDLVNGVLQITLGPDARVRSRWYAISHDSHDDGRRTQ